MATTETTSPATACCRRRRSTVRVSASSPTTERIAEQEAVTAARIGSRPAGKTRMCPGTAADTSSTPNQRRTRTTPRASASCSAPAAKR
jgi:hypothetical protein